MLRIPQEKLPNGREQEVLINRVSLMQVNGREFLTFVLISEH
jgi:hypothetical protein